MIYSERKTTREEGDYNACENRLVFGDFERVDSQPRYMGRRAGDTVSRSVTPLNFTIE